METKSGQNAPEVTISTDNGAKQGTVIAQVHSVDRYHQTIGGKGHGLPIPGSLIPWLVSLFMSFRLLKCMFPPALPDSSRQVMSCHESIAIKGIKRPLSR